MTSAVGNLSNDSTASRLLTCSLDSSETLRKIFWPTSA